MSTQATNSGSSKDAAPGASDNAVSSFDKIEHGLGISDYMSPDCAGFSGVVKARFSDFLVHEVGLDGEIARLTSQEIPTTDTVSTSKQEEEPLEPPSASKETPKQAGKTGSEEWATLQSQLQDMIKDEDVSKKVMTMLDTHNREQTCEDKFVTLPSLEKAQRKNVHTWIRESLPCARADTVEGRIRIWHVKFEKEMPNYKTFGNHNPNHPGRKKSKKSWPEDRPDFLQFVLYKENIDTTTATKELSRKGSKSRIGYAGMKDKRGITAQYCTLYRTEPQQILSQRQAGGGGNTKQKGFAVVQVGNFKYVSKEMRLGTLKGNRFDLILRNVKSDSPEDTNQTETLQTAAQAMKASGFINYFGTQRFGKYQDTHLVGIAVLQGDYRKAIDIMMSPKPDDRPDAAQGRKDWQERFQKGETAENEAASAKRVIKSLNRFMTAENSVMQCLSRDPLNYKKAFSRIPKTLRMMFLHAVQSLVWNKAASKRINMNKTEVLVGDLVLAGEGSSKAKVVTENDVTEKKYTMQDVVLPLVGTKSEFPTNDLGDIMKKLFADIGISVDMFKKIQDKDLAIYGDYRKLVVRPSDFDFEIKEYYHPVQPLLQTDLMKLNGEDIEIAPPADGETKKTAMIVGFTLPSSSYATVALRELMKKPTSSEYQKDLKLE